ncbi:MAG: hypothetical protein ABEJ23_07765 [Haloarculaceae archaeon]
MSEPPELWAFLFSNLVVLVFGGGMTALSVLAYRRSSTRSFRSAAVGFGLITAGALGDAAYQLVLRGSYELAGRELLALQTVQGILVALGLAVLFYSLANHDPGE